MPRTKSYKNMTVSQLSKEAEKQSKELKKIFNELKSRNEEIKGAMGTITQVLPGVTPLNNFNYEAYEQQRTQQFSQNDLDPNALTPGFTQDNYVDMSNGGVSVGIINPEDALEPFGGLAQDIAMPYEPEPVDNHVVEQDEQSEQEPGDE